MAKHETVAHELAEKQRDIGVAEFFSRNRHLLGFDNKRKALMTTIKEAVDNALDACEEANILPEIKIEIIDMENERYRVIIEDNGPGIPKELQERIFFPMVTGGDGMGLGLSISQTLINRHQGLIEFTSKPGQTVFRVLLPLEQVDG